MLWNASGYYTSNADSYGPNQDGATIGRYPWMIQPNADHLKRFYGKGHTGKTANFIFGDMHCDSMNLAELKSATSGSEYWAPSNFITFNGSGRILP